MGRARNKHIDDRLCDLCTWMRANDGKLPQRSAHKELFDFITEIRKKFNKGLLEPYQISILEQEKELRKLVEKWSQGLGAHHSFEESAQAVEQFVEEHGRLPHQVTRAVRQRRKLGLTLSEDEVHESRLGVFLSYSRERIRSGQLPGIHTRRLLQIPLMEELMDDWFERALLPLVKSERKRAMPPQKKASEARAKRAKGKAPESSSSSSSSSSDVDAPRPGNEVQSKPDRLHLAAVKDGDVKPLETLAADFMKKHAKSLGPLLAAENRRCLLFRYLNMRRKALLWWPQPANAYFSARESKLLGTCSAEVWEQWLTKEVDGLVEELYLKGSFSAPALFLKYLHGEESSSSSSQAGGPVDTQGKSSSSSSQAKGPIEVGSSSADSSSSSSSDYSVDDLD